MGAISLYSRKAFDEERTSNAGRPSFDRLMMFKILILQELYGLSDDQIEFQLLDRLSFQKFIGQGLNNRVPDAKTIWLFRNTLTKSGVIELLFIKLGKQLERHGLIAKKDLWLMQVLLECQFNVTRHKKTNR
ncbi:MAG: transposase [Bacteroidetes bacterium]|nr:transposase [Bacteroidota bacterium]MBK8872732.1 transposase [Bacteroidota bacterium]